MKELLEKLTKEVLIYILDLLVSKCPSCKEGKLRYFGDNFTGKIWVSIYKCNKCNEEFI